MEAVVTTGAPLKSIDQPATPGWGWALSHTPEQLRHLVERSRARLWVEALLRAADERLDGSLGLSRSDRNVEPQWLPGQVVPVVGARSAETGQLGVLHLERSQAPLAGASIERSNANGESSEVLDAIQRGIALACTPLAEFMPEALRPRAQLDLSGLPAGDSMALPAAMATVLWIFGSHWPADLIASGGIDLARSQFSPVPRQTLAAKARAARAWGYRRIALIEDRDAPSISTLEGLQVVRMPAEPGALPLALACLNGVDLDEERIACALAVFDLRVGRSGPGVMHRVLEVTEPMLELDSPIIRHIAHDMRSRAQLHAGRTEDASDSLHRADELHGRGSLPDGRLRDILRYQQPAHRSIVHVDLGDWSDELPAHRQVDRLIDELDGLWSTKHEQLMRLFLANTRARRQEYLGRLHSDSDRLDRAWSDLIHNQSDWEQLLDSYAVLELQLPDTSRARVENQLLDVAFSRFQLDGSIPSEWLAVVDGLRAQASPLVEAEDSVLAFEQAGRVIHIGGNGFDAIARLKRQLALDRPELPEEVESVLDSTRCHVTGTLAYPWFHWLELIALRAQAQGRHLPLPGDEGSSSCESAWGFVLREDSGITSLIGLRSSQILTQLGRAFPRISSPPADSSLGRLFADLASNSQALFRRTPY
ncbi:MAG: hypothetical protein CBC35_11950 [Planctomycetes bacterium TMED75]|nr:MAG: hypothetical protein CBC35_11950 [Planctomycetes bacterium TMED75]